MLNKKIAELINEQVNKELYSGYLYLDFANYYEAEGLDGFAHWYQIQAQEERDHAMMMRRYLIEHEQYVTSLINEIYSQAFAIKDFKTMQFLDWFIKEQGEEEKNAEDMLRKYELYGHDAKGLYALNQELAARVYTPSATGPAM